MASRAFPAVARFVLFMALDPDDEERRLLGQPKNQYGRSGLPTMVGHIEGVKVADTKEGPVATARMVWDGESSPDHPGCRGREPRGPWRDQRGDHLARGLPVRWPVPRTKVIEAARAAAHGEQAVKRAAVRLKVVSKPFGFPRRSMWSLRGEVRPGPGDQVGQASGISHGDSEPTDLTVPTDAVGSAGSSRGTPYGG